MVLGLLGHVKPAIFFRRILRSEALVYTSVFFSEQPFYGNYSTLDSHLVKMASKTVTRSIQLFLGVAEFKCFLLVCDVVWLLFSIFSFFCFVIWWLHPSATPRNYHGSFIGLYFDQSEGRTGKNIVLKWPLSLEGLFCQANKILVISSPDTKLSYSVKSHLGFYGKHRQRYCCESSANSHD